ncbi:hypothetical protein WS83_20100 [Burkholderia sp. MSMB2042]|nr:hypothetical protein WS78_11950 [Burkholderia savannae]KVG37505.1 hypothetical protein WS77_02180 [Burkholderia sp. MSMB0265]KVG88231.1 hypothetical protein WS81_25045 [Burkholderia sp. MSMB2040]KVG93781.1 hypothetical protein WS82_08540 [Burkholderia sp. MSMB2041]KVH01034.1 hypothetical protein WS83_20100 [Burkholderia sp. MSMB2042]KVK89933.1 hypothetical protein WS91_27705 [Burkholderia sp. MSMB1498]
MENECRRESNARSVTRRRDISFAAHRRFRFSTVETKPQKHERREPRADERHASPRPRGVARARHDPPNQL